MSCVLVADDEAALLDLFVDVVTDLGHRPLRARDGLEALELALKEIPDVIVTDQMMPRETGVGLLRALRKQPALADVPVILVSAGEPEGAHEAWRFLQKPLLLDELEHAISAALAEGRRRRPVALPPTDHTATVKPEDMLNWAAHELRTPLSVAMGRTEQLRRELVDRPRAVAKMDTISRALERMNELVTSILDAARLEEGRIRLTAAEGDLCSFLTRTVVFWRDAYPEFDFRVQLPGDSVLTVFDPEALRQVVDNLIANAVRYSRDVRTVELAVQTADQEAQVAVADQGIGIPEHEIPHIFNRFHRATDAPGRGHGLGLYIAFSLAQLHGGGIRVESTPGKGSRFTVYLPRRAVA